MRYEFGGLIFGGAYRWRGLFSEFYGIITVQKIKELWSDCLHRLHLDIAPLSKFGFQSSVSVSNLSANQREKLVNFPLLTNDIVEQQVSSIWSTLNTMAGPGSCSGTIERKKITHIKENDS